MTRRCRIVSGTVGLTVELAGLKSERSQTMTDTIDDVAAEAASQEEPVPPAIDEQGWLSSWWLKPERRE